MTGDVRPASGYKWEPFAPGHELSTKHGVYSERKLSPRVEELVAYVLGSNWLMPVDVPAVVSWATAKAQEERATAHLEAIQEAAANGVGDLTDPAVKAAYALLDRTQGRAARATARLGFDPMSRAQLGRDIAAAHRPDLAVLMADLTADDDEQDGGTDDDGDADEG